VVGNLHLRAWRATSRLFDDIIEEREATEAFDIQIHRTRWLVDGDAAFKPALPFIEMMLSPQKFVQGSYTPHAGGARYVPLGDVSFVPREAELHCRVQPGAQRSISCIFDVDRIAARAGIEWTWPDFDLEEALDLGNGYIRMALRRIAEELFSPSFASVAQIECSLMFVAMELLRVLGHDTRQQQPEAGRLTQRQLDRLREMVIDSIGEIPSLGELAAENGLCGRKLASAYRRTTGSTLRSFLANARLERAKMLLPDRSLLIKQVAYDCGFKNSASFTAAFRKATGLTPAEYRTAIGA